MTFSKSSWHIYIIDSILIFLEKELIRSAVLSQSSGSQGFREFGLLGGSDFTNPKQNHTP